MADHAVVADDEIDLSRRKFLTRTTIATGALGAGFAAVPFIESWSPSERARAQGAPTTFDLSKLEAGQMATTVWRRSPIYVVRRTPDMVERILAQVKEDEIAKPERATQPCHRCCDSMSIDVTEIAIGRSARGDRGPRHDRASQRSGEALPETATRRPGLRHR